MTPLVPTPPLRSHVALRVAILLRTFGRDAADAYAARAWEAETRPPSR